MCMYTCIRVCIRMCVCLCDVYMYVYLILGGKEGLSLGRPVHLKIKQLQIGIPVLNSIMMYTKWYILCVLMFV